MVELLPVTSSLARTQSAVNNADSSLTKVTTVSCQDFSGGTFEMAVKSERVPTVPGSALLTTDCGSSNKKVSLKY